MQLGWGDPRGLTIKPWDMQRKHNVTLHKSQKCSCIQSTWTLARHTHAGPQVHLSEGSEMRVSLLWLFCYDSSYFHQRVILAFHDKLSLLLACLCVPCHKQPPSPAFLSCVVMCDNCNLVPLTAFVGSLKGSRGKLLLTLTLSHCQWSQG